VTVTPGFGYKRESTGPNLVILACQPVGDGVSEMRIHYGPGYRVYYVQQGELLVILLAGGDKSTQSKDIATAIDLARQL
jgi:putative addiction module killer protein